MKTAILEPTRDPSVAISSAQRSPLLPDVPTFAEQGFPKLTTSTWVGISGPRGMSPDIVARLYDELQKAYKAPEVVERFKEVVQKYETSTHAPEALYRLTESYLAMGVPEEAKKAAAVLGANYPGSEWYARAYNLMQKHAPAA